MKSLNGRVFQTGAIEFAFARNQWAADWLEEKRAKKKTSPRITIDPKVVSISLELAEGLDVKEYNWLDRIQQLLRSSDTVFLKVIEGSFRFQKAVHDFGPTRQVLTIGATDIVPYAEKYWNQIKYFFAFRYEGFAFDVRKIVSSREGKQELDSFELITRIRPEPTDSSCHLSFLATGSTVNNEIIRWRSTIEKGESGRFSIDSTEVRFKVAQPKQPLTFLHEFREEFKNHSYEFEGDQIKSHLAKIKKRTPA